MERNYLLLAKFTMNLLSYQFESIKEILELFSTCSFFYHADTTKYFVSKLGLQYTRAGCRTLSKEIFFTDFTFCQNKIIKSNMCPNQS